MPSSCLFDRIEFFKIRYGFDCCGSLQQFKFGSNFGFEFSSILF